MMDVNRVALSWLSKAKSEQDCFNKFISLWFSFNALYNKLITVDERNAIGDLIYSEEYQIDETRIRTILNSSSVKFFTKRIIRDCRGNGHDTAEDAVILADAHRPLKRRLKALLIILYQIRCNLFHGNKIYERDSDQEVIKNAGNALTDVLSGYLNQET